MISYETLDIVYYTVKCFQATVAVFGNGLTMVAITRCEFLKSATNIFIFSLALNDFQIGLMTPLSVIIHYTRPAVTFDSLSNCSLNSNLGNGKCNVTAFSKNEGFLNWTSNHNNRTIDNNNEQFKKMNYDKNYFAKWSRLCLAKEITNSLQSFGSIIGIFLISVDRFIFIEKPLRYHDLMDIRKAIFSCILLWSMCIVVGPVLIPFSADPKPTEVCDTSIWSPVYFYGIVTPLFALLTTTNVILYVRIAFVAFSKSKTIVAPSVSTNQRNEINKQVQKGNRVTRMLSIVLGLYFVLYLPTIVFGSFGDETDSDILIIIKYVSFMLFFTAMCVNPFIYAWKSKEFRRAFGRVLHVSCDRQTDISTSEFSQD